MQSLLMVAIGGAAGAASRHLVGMWAMRFMGAGFPWGTLAVNVIGSFAMGIFIELLALRFQGSSALRLLVATGFLGGFTTFSAFSLDAVTLWERGEAGFAAIYILVSVLVSIAALFFGLYLVKSIFS
ncbi:MAG: fluoride efflux transporter CrcB [Rhizobiales bacterium]|nr:fluoride efflux transporter CrcB [Hyphomicrobiales bacterium]